MITCITANSNRRTYCLNTIGTRSYLRKDKSWKKMRNRNIKGGLPPNLKVQKKERKTLANIMA